MLNKEEKEILEKALEVIGFVELRAKNLICKNQDDIATRLAMQGYAYAAKDGISYFLNND